MDETSKHKLKLHSKLGSGAFGIVYKGTYDGTEVAVKTLSKADCRDAKQCFFREARTLERLNHENIVGYRALCKLPKARSAPGQYVHWALVLELVKGGSLYSKILEQIVNPMKKCYSDTTATHWALDVARGLEYLHLLNPTIIHRDIKCANILLGPGNGRVMAKISDFGLHVVCQGEEEQPRMARISFSHSGPGNPFVPLIPVDLPPSSTPPAVVASVAVASEIENSSSWCGSIQEDSIAESIEQGPRPVADTQQQQQQEEPSPVADIYQQHQQGGSVIAASKMQGATSKQQLKQQQQQTWEGTPCSLADRVLAEMRKNGSVSAERWIDDSAKSTEGQRIITPCSSGPGSQSDFYSEFHTGDGKRVVDYSSNSHLIRTSDNSATDKDSRPPSNCGSEPPPAAAAEGAPPNTLSLPTSAPGTRQPVNGRRSGSFSFGTAAADERSSVSGLVPSSNSFSERPPSALRRRSQHHTLPYACLASGGSFTALPRRQSMDVAPVSFAGAAAAAARAGGDVDDWLEEGSVCSMDSMCSMGTLASLCESATYGGPGDLPWDVVVPEMEVEAVFMLTGETGSCLYMAPEVHMRQPYNEKADVFSLGVVLYELFARNLVMCTELDVNTTDPMAPERYADRVAQGYRPKRPKKCPEPMWELITACWDADPVVRPHMSDVVDILEDYLSVLQKPEGKGKGTAAAAAAAAAADHGGGGGGASRAGESSSSQGCACVIS